VNHRVMCLFICFGSRLAEAPTDLLAVVGYVADAMMCVDSRSLIAGHRPEDQPLLGGNPHDTKSPPLVG
jgi:hypothetical protein